MRIAKCFHSWSLSVNLCSCWLSVDRQNGQTHPTYPHLSLLYNFTQKSVVFLFVKKLEVPRVAILVLFIASLEIVQFVFLILLIYADFLKHLGQVQLLVRHMEILHPLHVLDRQFLLVQFFKFLIFIIFDKFLNANVGDHVLHGITVRIRVGFGEALLRRIFIIQNLIGKIEGNLLVGGVHTGQRLVQTFQEFLRGTRGVEHVEMGVFHDGLERVQTVRVRLFVSSLRSLLVLIKEVHLLLVFKVLVRGRKVRKVEIVFEYLNQ